MFKYKCQVPHNPPHSHGDCLRACIATIIQRNDVPHVMVPRATEHSAWSKLRKYLFKNKKFILVKQVDDPWSIEGDEPFILLCRTETGNHAVVVKNGQVFNDPAQQPKEILGSVGCSEGWLILYIRNYL